MGAQRQKRARPPEPCTQNPFWVPSLPQAAALPTHHLPGFPEESPHSLFLQETHLQALQVQEPAQLQEPPARKGKASGEQGAGGATADMAGPSPSYWVGTSPGSSRPAQNRRKAHSPTPHPSPLLCPSVQRAMYCLVFTPKDEPRLRCPFRKPGSDGRDLLSEPGRGNIPSPPSLGNTEAWTEHWSRPRGFVTPG